MSVEAIRTAIAARISAVPACGQVHAFERYAKDTRSFKQFFKTEDNRILGWSIRRVSRSAEAETHTYTKVINRWQIIAVMGLVDDDASELAFDELVDTVIAAFALDETLGGTVGTTRIDNRDGLQLEESGPVSFAGVLCHRARLSLWTQHTEEITAEGLDDFLTGDVRWDLGPLPDESDEAHDTLTLEQDT